MLEPQADSSQNGQPALLEQDAFVGGERTVCGYGDAAVVDALVAHQYVEAQFGALLLVELEYVGGGGGGGGEGFEVYDVAE